MTKYIYIVYDSRAINDTDDARIFEVYSGRGEPTDNYLKRNWGEINAVLYRYDDNDGNLTNETYIKVIE